MNTEFIAEAVRDVTARYGADLVMTATESGRTLLRIQEVELGPACQPSSTSMLLVLDPAQPKPVPFVRPGQLLANGKVPRSTSITMVGSEPWMQFSFNIPWEERHGMVRFIAAARQRFAQNE
jgi:hypothetical protein